ncbi:hypothetical protein R9X50_00421700 [Acrodontium crateriforme]|uniref:Heme haloperoxidase family profile domain-containing protein n=1 Tax=Acrodontium crateriforme TaxID=150365 RepID=A0AAQ3M4X7_9PEZI|nr:hypothetical protein R9X50_00421700 [Acrodontium crateriforme]
MLSSLILLSSIAPLSSAFPDVKNRGIIFDPVAQLVSVSGEHAWKAPGPNDQRGPCPAMNAVANHGYIPRNGFTTIGQAVQGLNEALGISVEFGTVLAIIAAIEAGDGLAFSIGGPPPPNLIAGGLLGQPLGISYSHNRFEGDASLTRNDLYTSGDAHTLQLPLFKQLLDFAGDRDNFDLDVIGGFSALRYNNSLYNNPYFFRGPVGFAVPPGTSGLVANVFSNKSVEYPDGYLNKENLKSFFGVTGDDDNLQFTPGHERIPENWYKRNVFDPYSTASFAADMLAIYTSNPQIITLGGNTGKVNTMTPIDVGNLTGGVYNAANLLQGNNLVCFIFQVLAFESPDIISNGGVINDLLGLIDASLQSAVTNALSSLACPQLTEFDDGQLSNFPGYTKFHANIGSY